MLGTPRLEMRNVCQPDNWGPKCALAVFRHCAAEFVLTGDSVTATHVGLNKGSRMEQIGCVETRQESREGGAWELSGGCRVLCSVLRAWYYGHRTVHVKDVRRNGAVD